MIKINFKSVGKVIECDPADEKNLLDICLENDISLDHACGGNAACSTCHVKIVEGMSKLNEIDEIEEDLIDFEDHVLPPSSVLNNPRSSLSVYK